MTLALQTLILTAFVFTLLLQELLPAALVVLAALALLFEETLLLETFVA